MEIRRLSITHPQIKIKLGCCPDEQQGTITLLDVVINVNGDSLDLPTTVLGETRENDACIHKPEEHHSYFVSINGKDYALGSILKSDIPIFKQPYFLGLLTGLGVYLGPDLALNGNCERFFEEIETTEETLFDSTIPGGIIYKKEDIIPKTIEESGNVKSEDPKKPEDSDSGDKGVS